MTQIALRSKTQLKTRDKIEDLQSYLEKAVAVEGVQQTIFEAGTDEGDDQAEHYFGDKVYCRSLLIPAGTTVVGKIHLQRRVCIIAQGRCTFTDEFDSETVEAPFIKEFEAGSKTAVHAHTDTLWVACLGTEHETPKDVVDNLTRSNHTMLDGPPHRKEIA